MTRHRIYLTDNDKNIPKSRILCIYNDCVFMTDETPDKVKKLCPFCYKMGWCSLACLKLDIIRHVLTECDTSIKKPIWNVDKSRIEHEVL